MPAPARPAFVPPTIDLSPYVDAPAHRGDDRPAVARAFGESAQLGGFIHIVGHGAPEAVTAGLKDSMEGFFGLPDADKLALRLPAEVNRGYSPPRSEALSRSIGIDTEGRVNDNFESFNIGSAASESPALGLPPEHYSENVWPGHPLVFREHVTAYYREAQRVAGVLMHVIGDALEVAPSFFGEFEAAPVDLLRLNSYSGPDAGMGAHTDFGFVTVLCADQPGLQFLAPDSVWHDVVVTPGSLLVNLGDLAARLTNDVWPATLHRVRVPGASAAAPGSGAAANPAASDVTPRRLSAAFFHDGTIDTVIEPLPRFVEPGEAPLYEPITVRENLIAKLRGSRSGQRNYAAARDATRVRAARDLS